MTTAEVGAKPSYIGAFGVSLPVSMTSEQLEAVKEVLHLKLDDVTADPDDPNIFWGLTVEKVIVKTGDAIRAKLREVGVSKAATGKHWYWLSALERHPSKRQEGGVMTIAAAASA